MRGSQGILLIDCGFRPSRAADIVADRASRGGVTHAVLTHHHFDHILGSAGYPTPSCTPHRPSPRR